MAGYVAVGSTYSVAHDPFMRSIIGLIAKVVVVVSECKITVYRKT